MASIRQRGDTWQARVSLKGFPPESRTFNSKADARRWTSETEAAMRRGKHKRYGSPGGGVDQLGLRRLLRSKPSGVLLGPGISVAFDVRLHQVLATQDACAHDDALDHARFRRYAQCLQGSL